MENGNSDMIKWFREIGMDDVGAVGGKNASLGELLNKLSPLGINVPDGFAVTARAYRKFIADNNLNEPIRNLLDRFHSNDLTLDELSRDIRGQIMNSTFPIALAKSIRNAYRELSKTNGIDKVNVAVRSSATAEDLPDASFAGLQETYLNITGDDELLTACKKCIASLFTARAISYREDKQIEHMKVALSVGVQKMIRADNSGAGVMFTLDTETGFPNIVMINAAWGLGESVVQGIVNPDQYMVLKSLLDKDEKRPILEKKLGSKEQKTVYVNDVNDHTKTVPTTPSEQNSYVLEDEDILTLGRWAVKIEEHYEKPMDIEWVKENESGTMYIVQARPETVHSRSHGLFKTYTLKEEGEQEVLTGLSIGSAIAHGKVCKVDHISDLSRIEKGCILVAQMTEPDWVPAMKNVGGIITDFGGRTCHAAIISRELGIPAIVGSKLATTVLNDGQEVTLSCASGDEGVVYPGLLDFEVTDVRVDDLPDINTEIMLNLATPESAFKWWQLPVKGVGLARMEFIISNHIKIHPMALVHFDKVLKGKDREDIRKITKGYKDKKRFFIEQLSAGIAKIAASQYPHPVIVRTSDFKTNEYARLIGGEEFEPREDNPMIGWRGASRYYSKGYREGFALECEALKIVREQMGLDNVIVMIPFCRTISEAQRVLEEMEKNGLARGQEGLKIYMMCEIPSNVLLAEEFAQYFDGFSIGSNDLTQLVLGVDRDSTELAYLFDENDKAVKNAIRQVIERAHQVNCKVGLCGQAPSDDPEYARFLVDCGIDSISVNPDSTIAVLNNIHQAEKEPQKVTF